ncbi:hypothetical protein PtrSN002B_002789 [Pyrenophora tritici-repentis]|uniref:Uncharacterized protein n=1 Tax=Pyrenophora tritici-repentis TaxID=45151 RepID=A0A2W1EYP5_9PLEO|nr:hypothetical protein PtrV1_07143 [Pyrenophora tritici-repentis]KAF7448202.1 hypothetical protein A1F99_075660 [Pyrenophora tritici-repentis]KAF7571914.1 hypothetical protein PtrM4_094140 [Pyrenophora tritici-repentis]KAI0584518.1 hypothetical protein Alg215_02997 [Pyrenophora tritici-repentis]KAI0592611.1 hypothetical protein Alg130_00027 [Pyrenophora tritici-repentis]
MTYLRADRGHIHTIPKRMFDRSIYAFPHLERALCVRVHLKEADRFITMCEKFKSPVYKILKHLCQIELGGKKRALRVHLKKQAQTKLCGCHVGDTCAEQEMVRELSRNGWVIDVTREDGVKILKEF